MIDRTAVRDVRGDSGIIVRELLDRLEQQPDAALWKELDSRLVVEAECCCSAGFAALPALSRLARSDDTEQRDRALDLAAVITRTPHRNHEDDHLASSAATGTTRQSATTTTATYIEFRSAQPPRPT
ncbi:hypothetical protein [Actinoplanes couchii]|uniref:Uncharacterized protein n=1 Tax=Actinoplanes couchii TaxID=403638 RepID=A0ABQ3XMD2_9ACTN|nr:hypothetical protein [Actinoplanes couchii]MDR6319202.1 hypothetical protein [Actinoplanes couchii]GID59587.1 hypothetical protein Aco03nite_079910 [Actinoplanes couchii]